MQSQVRFNRVPGLGLGGFGAEPDQVEQGSGECSGEGSGRLWCRAMSGSTGFRKRFWRRFREALLQSQVKFNKFRREGSGENSGEGLGGFGAEPGQVQQGFGEGLGGFGAEPGQVQQGSEKVSEKVWEALVRSPVGFNRVPEKVLEKVPEKAPGGFGAEPGQVQQGSGEGSGEGLGGSGAESGQVQQDLRAFNSQKPSLGVWLRSMLQKDL